MKIKNQTVLELVCSLMEVNAKKYGMMITIDLGNLKAKFPIRDLKNFEFDDEKIVLHNRFGVVLEIKYDEVQLVNLDTFSIIINCGQIVLEII